MGFYYLQYMYYVYEQSMQIKTPHSAPNVRV